MQTISSKVTPKATANLQEQIEKELALPDPSPADFAKAVANAKSLNTKSKETKGGNKPRT